MNKRSIFAAGFALAMLILANPTGHALTFVGSLSTGTTPQGVDTTGGSWLDDFKIKWTISDLGSGVWEYIYELTQADGSALDPGKVSHAIVEVSRNAKKSDFWNFKADGVPFDEVAIGDFGPGTHGNSNPNIPGTIHGLKLDEGGGTIYSFLSSKAPVWGDFYAKDGRADDSNGHGGDHGSNDHGSNDHGSDDHGGDDHGSHNYDNDHGSNDHGSNDHGDNHRNWWGNDYSNNDHGDDHGSHSQNDDHGSRWGIGRYGDDHGQSGWWSNFDDHYGDGHGSGDKPFNAAWNADFLEEDPTAGPRDGLLSDGHGGFFYKILRPDTKGRHDCPKPEVPEPATLALLTLGLAAGACRRHKRK